MDSLTRIGFRGIIEGECVATPSAGRVRKFDRNYMCLRIMRAVSEQIQPNTLTNLIICIIN